MTDDTPLVGTTDDDTLLVVSGELDADSCPPLRTALIEALSARVDARARAPVFEPSALLLDLSPVTFASSAALSLLLEIDARATAGHVPLILVVPAGSMLDRLLEQTGLVQTLTVVTSVDAARRR